MLRRRLAVRNVHAARYTAHVLEDLTPAISAFLPPMATMAFALSLWSLGAQFAVASNFPINSGLLADWRAWMLIAGALEGTAMRVRTATDTTQQSDGSENPRQ